MAFDSDSPNENRNKAPKTLDDLHGIAQGPGCSELIKVSEFIDSFSANHLATGAAFVYLRETTEVNKALTIHRMMSVDDETFRSLSVAMEHSQLMCGCEEVDCTVIPDNDDGWISLRIRKSDLQRSRPWHASSSCMLRLGSLKTDLRLPAFPEPPGPRIVEGGPRVRWLEATLTVSLFRTPPTGTPAFVDLIGQFAVLGSTELQSLVNRFRDLSIRLGRPYVYMHNGDCQHHVVFNDIRLLNEQRDDSDINNYPMLLGQRVHQQVNVTCQMCGKGPADWVITDHPKMRLDPTHICSSCNRIINYDANGKKNYDFKLFSFTDWSQL
ncbi:uncharacterized protein LOC111261532 isoform X4 [Varroa jacobsoni]|uniref:snRNA-activating protein complex subunit 3 n=1 Tax=Varroa destructor TaxID=109461 RepID=A0A7M7K7M6_VARDE|nr:uncharacterized protein LOC111250827 isoform X4 [Varroa destructor]XP_022690845.1 uncharacterized protein LOC111261532 isoform X4 [Varroa jacobsoni]